MAKCSDGKSIAYGKIKQVRNHLKFFLYDDRITNVGLKPDRADVIMPALKLDISVMKWGGIQNISAPQIGLADGLVRIMYRAHTQSTAQPTRKSSKRRTKPLSGKRQTAPPMDIRFHWPGKRKRNQHDHSLLCHSRS
jgi:exopolyphosphatase/guanosine-5'-triphosphate,3'-diphosphate pyrophosphatase